MNEKPIAVVGAGPSGLLQALFLATHGRRRVIVLEQSAVFGGMFGSVDTPWGMVDQGIHILQETGDPDWDRLIFELLEPEEWHVFEGVRKDIGGNIFEGQLNAGCMFPDLRLLPPADYVRALGELFARAGVLAPRLADAPNLAAYFERRFGPYAAGRVIGPAVHKVWQQPLAALSPWAARIVYLSRVVTHSAAAALALKEVDALDAVVAFPDQLQFPAERLSDRLRTLYPVRYGLRRLVERLCAALRRSGAELLSATRIADVHLVNGRVDALQFVRTTDEEAQRVEVEAILWTSPYDGLLRLLGLPSTKLPDRALPHRMVHLFLDGPPLTGELYWLRSYDRGDPLLRVSNPAAYCPDAAAGGRYPVCIEMHVSDAGIADDVVLADAQRALRSCRLIAPDTAVVGGVVLGGGRNLMLPTLANCEALTADRQAIENAGIPNLVPSAADISSGIFYLPEILNASTEKLKTL